MRDIWRMNMCERANGEQSYARSLWGAQLQFDSIINSQTNATCYVICHIFYPTSYKTTSFTQVYTSSYENETNKLQTIHLWIYLSVLNLARDICVKWWWNVWVCLCKIGGICGINVCILDVWAVINAQHQFWIFVTEDTQFHSWMYLDKMTNSDTNTNTQSHTVNHTERWTQNRTDKIVITFRVSESSEHSLYLLYWHYVYAMAR